MANASVAAPTVATDRPRVLNGMIRPPMAGKLHRYARQQMRKRNGYRVTRRGVHIFVNERFKLGQPMDEGETCAIVAGGGIRWGVRSNQDRFRCAAQG